MDGYLTEITQFLSVSDIFRFACTRKALFRRLHSQELASGLVKRRPQLRTMYNKIDVSDISTENRPGFMFRCLFCFDSGIALSREVYETMVRREYPIDPPDSVCDTVSESLFSDDHLIIPPDVILLMKVARIDRFRGLRFPILRACPIVETYGKCRKLIEVAQLFKDMEGKSMRIFVIADPAHPWYGRCIWYHFIKDGLFHGLTDCYSFAEVLHFLVCKRGLEWYEVVDTTELRNNETLDTDVILPPDEDWFANRKYSTKPYDFLR